MMSNLSFQLNDNYTNKLKHLPNPFPNTPRGTLGYITYYRTYSRIKNYETKELESWPETVIRVINGAYTIQKDHITDTKHNLGWNEVKAQESAYKMGKYIHSMKFLPPGRGLWSVGTKIIHERDLGMAAMNCAFISTKHIDVEFSSPFRYAMDAEMLGVGVGFDCAGANKIIINKPLQYDIMNITNKIHTAWKRREEEDLEDVIDEYLPIITSLNYNSIEINKITSDDIIHNIDELKNIQSLKDHIMNYYKESEFYIDKERNYKYLDYELDMYKNPVTDRIYVIDDTREGWVKATGLLLDSYFCKNQYTIIFNYSKIREKGIPLRTFGGMSSGPLPLIELIAALRYLLDQYIGKPIDSRLITDIMNLIGRTVVSGNVRRTAEICFIDQYDKDGIDLKNYLLPKNQYRLDWSWASNNSIKCDVGSDYTEISERIKHNGEPGILWLQNAREYGRMIDPPNYKDMKADGTNPCGEITLEGTAYKEEDYLIDSDYVSGGEVCNLVEVFINRCENLEEFLDVLKYATIYAKTMTLLNMHWIGTNRIQQRNRRIGVSLTGIQQFIAANGNNLHILRDWLDKGYKRVQQLDTVYSDWFAVPKSIKTTTVKPSGTVSLLACSTSGIHWPESKYYIRRMRISNNCVEIIELLKDAGYHIEPAVGQETTTSVIEFPIYYEDTNIKFEHEVSIWEKVAMLVMVQEYWADNQVSCTITFDPVTEGDQIKHILKYYDTKLKSISFLPRTNSGYAQMPIEPISEEIYNEIMKNIKPISYNTNMTSSFEEETDNYCSGDNCIYIPKSK